MAKVKDWLLSQLESDPVLHEQYWFNELFNNQEPVLPDYSIPFMELSDENNLSI